MYWFVAVALLIAWPILLSAAPSPDTLSPAPLADPAQVVTAHAPYEAGECALCHERSDPVDPAPLSPGPSTTSASPATTSSPAAGATGA